MTTEQLTYWTSGTYWLLVICWAFILIFYVRQYLRLKKLSVFLSVLLIVIIIDGARTLFESTYFGVWYTARTPLLPKRIYDLLSEPQWIVLPKMLNLAAALVIIFVIFRRWLPHAEEELTHLREVERLHEELTTTHEKLKQLHQMQDDLTHMVAHDMQNPLTAVIGSLKTITEDKGLPAEQHEELTQVALGSAETVRARVSDLLDLTRLESGRIELDRTAVSPLALAEDAKEQVSYHAAQIDLKVVVRIAEDLPEIDVDRSLIHRVLVNLLDNAIKYSPPGGEIVVSAALEPNPGRVRLSVKDQGEGVPETIRGRIFEKFFTVNGDSGRARSSWGLGLPFCRYAVEAHGGRIWVESDEDQGSTFSLTLPVRGQGPGASG